MSHVEQDAFTATMEALSTRGAQVVLDEMSAIPDPKSRHEELRSLYQRLAQSDTEPRALDWMIEVGELAIRDAQAISETDPANESAWLDQANVHCYNVAANLADCWGDRFVREPRHFELGLAMSDTALQLRRKLGKDPAAFGMAWWIKGKHLMSLDRMEEARDAFADALEADREAARAAGQPDSLSDGAPWGVVLYAGYLAIARAALGEPGARDDLERVYAHFETEKAKGGEAADDADFGLVQLKLVANSAL